MLVNDGALADESIERDADRMWTSFRQPNENVILSSH